MDMMLELTPFNMTEESEGSETKPIEARIINVTTLRIYKEKEKYWIIVDGEAQCLQNNDKIKINQQCFICKLTPNSITNISREINPINHNTQQLPSLLTNTQQDFSLPLGNNEYSNDPLQFLINKNSSIQKNYTNDKNNIQSQEGNILRDIGISSYYQTNNGYQPQQAIIHNSTDENKQHYKENLLNHYNNQSQSINNNHSKGLIKTLKHSLSKKLYKISKELS